MIRLPVLILALAFVATPVAADPATLVIGALTASGVAVSTFAAAAIRIGVGLALSALARALAPGRGKGPGGVTLRSMTAGEQVPQSLILGRYVTAGNLVAPEMSHGTGGDTRYLTRVVDLCSMRIEALESLIVDGVACTLATGTPATLTMTHGDGTTDAIHPSYGPTVNKGDFIGFAWCKSYDGTQGAANGMLVARYGSAPHRPWEATMIGTGVAYAILTFLWRESPQVWKGRPDVRFVVKGIRLYDPRKDGTAGGAGAHRYGNTATHEWTENPVVMIYNLFRGIQLPGNDVFGGGFTAAQLPCAPWAAAMNACDVLIGTRRTYTAGLEVLVGGADAGDMSPADVVEELLKACAGQIADLGGTIHIRVGAPGLPVMFITDDDVLVSQGQELDPFPGAEVSHNVIHATWMNPATLWTPKEATPRRDEDAIAADGQELPADIALPAVTNPQQVQQLMSAWLKDAQRHRRHAITLPPEGLLVRPLDVIDWTSTRNGYAGKSFEVDQVTIDPATLCTTLALREIDPDDYDWVVGDEIAVGAPSVEPILSGDLSVPGFTAVATSIPDASGTSRRPAIQMSWTPNLPGIRGVALQVRVKATGALIFNGSSQELATASYRLEAGVLPSTTYQCRARLVSEKPTVWTDWAAEEVTTGAIYTSTDDLAGQAVTVAVTTWRPEKRRFMSSATWVRVASLGITRAAGFQTELGASFGYDGFGTGVLIGRLLRGTTQIASAAFTTGYRGSQMQGSWVFVDGNTAAGATTYALEFRQGTALGDVDVEAWNVRFSARQVKR